MVSKQEFAELTEQAIVLANFVRLAEVIIGPGTARVIELPERVSDTPGIQES
jgi:hypothetical protein